MEQNRKCLTIHEPYLAEYDNTTRLCANIEYENTSKVMYFEVEKEYGQYLCYEVADAFVVGLLNFAMALGFDIESEGPVSERLLYQIRNYFIPVMPVVRHKVYKSIKLSAVPYAGTIQTEGCVGTSASGGVDSYYSICKHLSEAETDYNLTHLLIANQFNIYGDENTVKEQFDRLIEYTEKIPNNYGLEFVKLYTNHHMFLFDGFVQEYTLRICSYALALQKLFSVYYVSSGVSIKEFGFENHDSDGFDIFNLPLMSNNQVTFYSSGGEVGRTEKIRVISGDTFVQNNLKVCNDIEDKNCGICEKCLRTMLSLDILGELENFREAFPVDKYKTRKNKYLSIVEANYIEASADLLESIEKYNYKVPLRCIILGRSVLKWLHFIKELLKKCNWLREIYFRLKIDFIVYGREKAIVYRYGTKHEIKEIKGND